jgi:hypothetical protein
MQRKYQQFSIMKFDVKPGLLGELYGLIGQAHEHDRTVP